MWLLVSIAIWSTVHAVVMQDCAVPEMEISVCRDATFCLESSMILPCSGDQEQPDGNGCPVIGSLAAADCNNTVVSYTSFLDACVARETAECVRLDSGTWGCVFPTIGCTEPVQDDNPVLLNASIANHMVLTVWSIAIWIHLL